MAPDASDADGAWRLLGRIALARWVVIAFAISYVFINLDAHTSSLLLICGIIVASAVNSAVALRRKLPWLRADATAFATVTVDFLWVTVAALATGADGDLTLVVGYVVVASESGILMGARGAFGSVLGALLGLITLAVLHPQRTIVVEDLRQITYEAGAIVMAAIFAAGASAEARAQHEQLTMKSASLARHARTDHLTGLGNVVALQEAVASIRSGSYGLLLVDIDGLRSTNAIYGHEAGDEMLLSVARLLRAIRAQRDLPVRLAEDKFVLLLPGSDAVRTAEAAENVRVSAHGVASSGGDLRVSVGYAWSSPGEALDAVMARADDALFVAKARGGDRVIAQGAPVGERRWRWRSAVEMVLESDRSVYAVYQEIVGIDPPAPAGWEALSRPRDWPPEAGVEGLFLTAHRMGRSRELDWRCRRTSLWEAGRLKGDLFINANVGAIADPVHDVDQLLLLCTWARRDPRSIVLELSERDAVPDLARLRRVLADYRAAGFRFAVDDVGEGQTTLELLFATRPEFLKVAHPLLHAARGDPFARSATRALVAFAHDTGARVIAEGIEDETDLFLCMDLSIDLGQGWLFGRPLPAERLPL